MSVLSLKSDEEIDVSAQNKFEILSSPRTTLLEPVEISPDGELERPER